MVDLIKNNSKGLEIIYFSKINIMKKTIKNKNDEYVEYINFRTLLPYELKNFLAADEYVYFYVYENKIYLTNTRPDDSVLYVRRKIQVKKGSYYLALPKKLFLKLSSDDCVFEYILHTGLKDFVNESYGLLECNVK